MIELFRYQRKDGSEPFSEWLDSLRDKTVQARICLRLQRVQTGNSGDIKFIGEGVSELRIHAGAGYRVYFGRHGKAIVILLCGGDKSSQEADIERAKEYWAEWKGRQPWLS